MIGQLEARSGRKDTAMLDSAPQTPVIAVAPLPPPYSAIHRHDLLPAATHDETARMNFLINLVSHVGAKLAPAMPQVYAKRVQPAFRKAHGRDFATTAEVRDAMRADPVYQTWAALRRGAQEMRHQAGRSLVIRQLEDVDARARRYNDGAPTLKLDPRVHVPKYVAVDNHLSPGGYDREVLPGDIAAGACYEAGHFVTAGGGTGAKSDWPGRSIAHFVRTRFPDFKPRRIVDLGAGGGFNTLPIAELFPEAEVIAVDAAAPMLRYGHARARAMGVTNVTFLQADGETLDLPAGSVDWVQTTMVWHETATGPFRAMLAKIRTLLRPGGLSLNFEQPNFDPDTPMFERFIRDWDAWYNNEPFWAKLHTLSFRDEMARAGFDPARVFEEWAPLNRDTGGYPAWVQTFNRHDAEHDLADRRQERALPGKKGLYLFGAWV
jgi:ubiquinone/menaquinone biosynthesis C-methylase UbiE